MRYRNSPTRIGGAYIFFLGYFNVYVWLLLMLHTPTREGIDSLKEMQAQMAAGQDANSSQQVTIMRDAPLEMADIRLDEHGPSPMQAPPVIDLDRSSRQGS